MPFTRPIRMDIYVLSDNCQFGLQDHAVMDFVSETAIKVVFNPADVNPWFPSRPKVFSFYQVYLPTIPTLV